MKKKIIIISSLGAILIVLGVVISLLAPPEIDNTGYTLIENLKVPVYSKLKVKDLIASIDGKVITNKTLNTEELGKQEVSFVYKDKNNKEKRGVFTIDVVDEEKPLVWLSGSYSARVGSDLNLEDEIFCADNYDSNPTCKIEGTYDLNTAGIYPLRFFVTDSDGNESNTAVLILTVSMNEVYE